MFLKLLLNRIFMYVKILWYRDGSNNNGCHPGRGSATDLGDLVVFFRNTLEDQQTRSGGILSGKPTKSY